MSTTSSTFTTTVHPFPSSTSNACAYEIGRPNAKNALVFIGGLGDGPHTVPYPRALAKRLDQEPALDFSVFEFRLSSSFSGFGFLKLADDVADISALVNYLRSIGKERVVLMGHSTGSQDCAEYTLPAHNASSVDGYILQAPVCDSDAFALEMGHDKLHESVSVAKRLLEQGKGHERMDIDLVTPSMKNTPISVWRWYSLAASDGQDNYFSPSLSRGVASSFWARIDKPLLILHSGNDEYVPALIDKDALVKEWMGMCQPGIASDLSGTIPGAGHRVEEPEAEEYLCETVRKFLIQNIK
ncbi:dolichol-phosphate mannosyltransferase [Poronia punctata]|nr:dolichol-phosphate mannosyltransferase [Poronia punctata]